MLVKYVKPRPCRAFDCNGVATQFIPGVNQVKRSVWDELMKNKNFKRDVDREFFEVITDEEPKPLKDGADGSPLSLFENVRAAMPIIKETHDRKLLLSWRSREDRKTIIDEIDAQIARIDKRIKGKSEKEKE